MGRLIASIRTVFRMFREFITRQVTRLWASFRRATSLTTQSAKALPKALSAAAAAGAKPVKRSDYVETGRLFIAKKFIVMAIIILLALGLLIYFVGWPWFVSKFLVLRMPETDERAADYNGKVELYYDEPMEHLLFRGTLEEGKKTGEGALFREDGMPIYQGEFEKDNYHGMGRLYNDRGQPVYEGQFADGLQEGNGTEYDEGNIVYAGQFAAGERSGLGREYELGAMVFEGEYKANVRDGAGRAFDTAGNLIFEGEYKAGRRKGEGTEYYPNGNVQYKGEFADDLYSGEGTLYDEDGLEHYSGGFDGGVFSGDGTLHLSKSEWKSGSFTDGEIAGTMTWHQDGKLYYAGDALESLPDGSGSLYNPRGAVVFTGAFAAGEIDADALLGMPAEDVRTAYAEAAYTEEMTDEGFNLRNEEAGIEVFCSFATEDEGAVVRRVFDITGQTPRLLAEDGDFKPLSRADILGEEKGGGKGGGGGEGKTAEDVMVLLPPDLDMFLEIEIAMVTYEADREIRTAVEKQLQLRNGQLEQLTDAQLTGAAGSKEVSAMQTEVDKLTAAMNKAQLAMDRAAETIGKPTGIEAAALEEYDLSGAFVEGDPAAIDRDAFLQAMIASDLVTDPAELEKQADDMLYTLSVLFADMDLAQKTLTALEEGLPDVKDGYVTGKSTREAYCDGMCEYYQALADHYAAWLAFSTEMYKANRASGGFICLQFGPFIGFYEPFLSGK